MRQLHQSFAVTGYSDKTRYFQDFGSRIYFMEKHEEKNSDYGKILLDYSLEKAKELGCGALCFEGNIDFYGKSGFKQASEFGIRYHGLPEGEDASFFLCKELIPGYLNGITGEYATPAGYLVNEKEAEAFDREFPYMEKEKLPGQIFE